MPFEAIPTERLAVVRIKSAEDVLKLPFYAIVVLPPFDSWLTINRNCVETIRRSNDDDARYLGYRLTEADLLEIINRRVPQFPADIYILHRQNWSHPRLEEDFDTVIRRV